MRLHKLLAICGLAAAPLAAWAPVQAEPPADV